MKSKFMIFALVLAFAIASGANITTSNYAFAQENTAEVTEENQDGDAGEEDDVITEEEYNKILDDFNKDEVEDEEEGEEAEAVPMSEEDAKAVLDAVLKDNNIEVIEDENAVPEDLEKEGEYITKEQYQALLEELMKTGHLNATINTLKAEYEEEDSKTEEAKEIKEDKKPEVKVASAQIVAPNTGAKKADNLSLIALANVVLAGASLVVFRKK